MTGNYLFQAVLNGFVCVDTFFFLTGLLLAYMTFKEFDKTNGKMNIIMYYVHRYIRYTIECTFFGDHVWNGTIGYRLTSIYAVVVLFAASLFKWAWNVAIVTYDDEPDDCKAAYYRNLLYFNNIEPLQFELKPPNVYT